MNQHVIAYDLGTGGLKASIFSDKGEVIDSIFIAYSTYYTQPNLQEQAPEDWWNAIVEATQQLLRIHPEQRECIKALAISGHSLGVVPVDKEGNLLLQKSPIWSDMRAEAEANQFFTQINYESWYNDTGNGFPPACYSIFKIMWYRNHYPDLYANIHKVIGTKDYCNFRFTGQLYTDYSYASGSGVFNLKKWSYDDEYILHSGIDRAMLPDIISSDSVIGRITPEAAAETGLSEEVQVICGGVDNSCMALGAKGISDGRIYTSLGSSAWIALVSETPVLDFTYKPYVFAHVIERMYASATCIFSAGTSQKWVRDLCCSDLIEKEKEGENSVWEQINELVKGSKPGANGVLFNPSLAGGSMMEPTPFMSGAFTGLKLSHTRADLLRATQEGVALNLRIALDVLRSYYPSIKEMLVVGGGAKSDVWMQIFADMYGIKVEKTNIDQEAASLGAAALALKGIGIWNDYSIIDSLHQTEREYIPQVQNKELYEQLLKSFKELTQFISTTC